MMRFQRSIGKTTFVCGCSMILSACHPSVQDSTDLPSPDSRWIATLQHVDNGLGFGQGALYDEVHLSRSNAWRIFWRHGEPDKSVIFYVESANSPSDTTKLRWIDTRNLTIAYPKGAMPGRHLDQYKDITITYQTFDGGHS
jgi:hypothetical protein